MKSLRSIIDDLCFFLLIGLIAAFGVGCCAALHFDGHGDGYYSTLERVWDQIFNPNKRRVSQNALRQLPLAPQEEESK